eukprot:3649618-Rhodomonas_salina.1
MPGTDIRSVEIRRKRERDSWAALRTRFGGRPDSQRRISDGEILSRRGSVTTEPRSACFPGPGGTCWVKFDSEDYLSYLHSGEQKSGSAPLHTQICHGPTLGSSDAHMHASVLSHWTDGKPARVLRLLVSEPSLRQRSHGPSLAG